VISTVTFDFWETLVQDSPENLRAQSDLRLAALRRALEQAGEPRDAPQIIEAYERSGRLLAERFWNRNRDLSHPDQVRLVLDCCVAGVADRMAPTLFEELVEAYVSPVLAHPPALTAGAVEAVRGLAARGVTLGIISNTGRTPGIVLRRLLERHDLLRHFRVISYSDEVGYRKPGPEIFRLTLDRAGANPSSAAHVGDNPVDDVTGAKAVGMRGVHFAHRDRPQATHADLTIESLEELLTELFRIAS
jgi:putative hydrolase of the HAD superfamily